MESNNTITLEDLFLAPGLYGLPTFEEYCKNPDKWMSRDDEVFVSAEEGPHLLKESNLVKDIIWQVNGYKCDSLEQADKLCKEMGLNIRELDMKPEMEKDLAGKYRIICNLVQKGGSNA